MLQNANLSACALDHKTYYHFSVEKYLPDYIPLKQELSLDKGSITVLLGTSGVGKTSLINACIDESINHKLNFACQNQHTTLMHHKTVFCHIKLPFKLQGKSVQRAHVLQILKDVSLFNHRYKKVSQLSKGMQQRLQFAMTIMQKVPLYFLDEPFSSQDAKMRQNLYRVIQKYCAGKTVLIVTHCDQDLYLLTRTVFHLKKENKTFFIEKNAQFKKHCAVLDYIQDDYLEEAPCNQQAGKTSSVLMYRLCILGSIFLLWALIIKIFSVPSYIIPKPLDVALAFYENLATLAYHMFHSILPLVLGMVIAILCSTILSLIIYRNKRLTRAIEPFLVALQSVPVFLILPILLYICGSGLMAKIVALSITTFFPLFAGILQGLDKTPPVWVQQKLALKAPEYRFLYYVRFVYAIPFIWQGLRLSLIHAPLSVLAVDWIGASTGLGYLIMLSHGQLELPLMFCGLFIVIGLSLCLNYGARCLDRKII